MGSCISRDEYDFALKEHSAAVSPAHLSKPVQTFDTLGRKSKVGALEEAAKSQPSFENIRQSVSAKIRALSDVSQALSSEPCDTISNASSHLDDLDNDSVMLSFDRSVKKSEENTLSTDKWSTIGELPDIRHAKEKTYLSSRLSWRGCNLTEDERDSVCSNESMDLLYWKRGNKLGAGSFGETYLSSRLSWRGCNLTEDERDSVCSNESMDLLYWKRGNKLGAGSFGEVYLGLTDMGELIAVKQIDISSCDFMEAEREYDKIYREVNILKNLRHRNIVQYLGSSLEDSRIFIFTQFVSGGSLSNIIQKFGPLEEHITARYTKQLLDAISYMHSNNVVHRDIKSANVMLMPEGVIKLIDFGCARKLELRLSKSGSQLMKSLKGTPYWMAPEVINESGHGKKSDIWSLGCTVFEMLTGSPPWGDREPFAAIYAIGSEDIPMPDLPEQFSAKAIDFVNECLTRDKKKRPQATKLKTHQFVHPIPDTQLSYESCSTEGNRWVEKRL